MDPNPGTSSRYAEVARLDEEVRRTADYIITRARAALRFGAAASAYRISAESLDRQASRAEELLHGQAAETFRTAAAENRLVADALESLTEL